MLNFPQSKKSGATLLPCNSKVYDQQMHAKVLLPLLLINLCSCAPASAPAPTQAQDQKPKVANATKGNEIAVAGLVVTPPENWVSIDLASGDAEQALKRLGEEWADNEQAAAMVRGAAASGMVKLIAIDSSQLKGPFQRNFNVVVTPPAGKTMDEELKANELQLAVLGEQCSVKSATKVGLPAGEAGLLVTEMKTPSLSYSTIGYLLHHNEQTYTFTFSCLGPDYEATAKLAEDCMKTVQFTD